MSAISGPSNMSGKERVVGVESVTPSMNLHYYSPVVSNGRVVVSPPEDVANGGSQMEGLCCRASW